MGKPIFEGKLVPQPFHGHRRFLVEEPNRDRGALQIKGDETHCQPRLSVSWFGCHQVAAERFLRRVLDGEAGAQPRVVITDKLASYPPAIRKALPNSEHRQHKGLNNRAEISHLPTRKRERILQRVKSAEHAQRFLVPFSAVSNHFRPRRHRLTASTYRQFRTQAHTAWLDVTLAGVCH